MSQFFRSTSANKCNFFSDIFQKAKLATINTLPLLPNNVVATGYDNLQASVLFQRSRDKRCRWKIEDDINNQQLIQFYECKDHNLVIGFSLKCSESNNFINTTLIFQRPIQSPTTISIECKRRYSSWFSPKYVEIAKRNLHVSGKFIATPQKFL